MNKINLYGLKIHRMILIDIKLKTRTTKFRKNEPFYSLDEFFSNIRFL